MQKLTHRALSSLPGIVRVPEYDRSELTVGIVHFGVGGFHRAHQAMYLDDLMADGLARDWAICGVGVLPGDAHMKRVMDAQDCLYTLVRKYPDGHRDARVIGSIVEYLYAPDDPEAVIERMASELVRIISLTITEGGYNFNQATGEFDTSTPSVLLDLEPDSVPSTVFGLITEALRRRRKRGLAPFTVMSCDNIQGNGDVARRVFTSFAKLKDPDLGEWIAESVHFPNSMVDRITPATTDGDRMMVAHDFDIEDSWPVVCEPFVQWVLEENHPLGRPPFEKAGVQMVEDVRPFELMKLRLLNASHQGLSYFGMLAGYTYVHEACEHEAFRAFLLQFMVAEATPTLEPVPGIDLGKYRTTLIDRFSNKYIRDTLARIGTDASDRIPKFLLPVVQSNLENDGEIRCAAAIFASWARYCEGIDEHGQPLDIVDRLQSERIAAAQSRSADPLAFIRNEALFGDLSRNERFAVAYSSSLQMIHEDGIISTLEALAKVSN